MNGGRREHPESTRADLRGLAAKKFRGRPRHGTELGSGGSRIREPTASTTCRNTPRRDPDNTASTYPYHHLAQARHVSRNPHPDQARHAPVLRANPYPEVTDPICRLPLPTLFYRLEAIHLGDLLRIWVRAGARPPRGPLPDFQGPRGRSGHRRNCGALRVPNHISLLEDSMELERSCRKENSSLISRRRLRVTLGYPDELSFEGPNFMRFRCRVPE